MLRVYSLQGLADTAAWAVRLHPTPCPVGGEPLVVQDYALQVDPGSGASLTITAVCPVHPYAITLTCVL